MDRAPLVRVSVGPTRKRAILRGVTGLSGSNIAIGGQVSVSRLLVATMSALDFCPALVGNSEESRDGSRAATTSQESCFLCLEDSRSSWVLPSTSMALRLPNICISLCAFEILPKAWMPRCCVLLADLAVAPAADLVFLLVVGIAAASS